MSGFEAGRRIYLRAPRGACVFVFHLFIFSPAVFSLFLCAPLGACLLPLHLCLLRHCTLGSSSSLAIHSFLLSSCLCQVGLRLSRQVVKLEHVRLSDCFNEPGWATTCRCDNSLRKFVRFFTRIPQRHLRRVPGPFFTWSAVRTRGGSKPGDGLNLPSFASGLQSRMRIIVK